jgi:hypothetical protein
MIMPNKIKIGDIVYYRPKDRMLNAARGTYAVVGGPAARIRKHLSEDFERVALENELTAGDSEHGQR